MITSNELQIKCNNKKQNANVSQSIPITRLSHADRSSVFCIERLLSDAKHGSTPGGQATQAHYVSDFNAMGKEKLSSAYKISQASASRKCNNNVNSIRDHPFYTSKL